MPFNPPRRSRLGGRLLIAGVIAGISLLTYFWNSSKNPVTGESQRVALSEEQEVALGLQAREEMAAQFGGLHRDESAQQVVDRVGQRLVQRSVAARSPYTFEFHLLADEKTINAFALPGGQIFITAGLYARLGSEAQLAGVLGHEIGHVIERHGAEHMATAQLTQGLIGSVVAGTGDLSAAQVASMVGQLVNLKYGRDDELESDRWGVRLLADAGYDPRALIAVMRVLSEASGGAGPDFFASHPNPTNRIGEIERLIAERYPGGVPDDLEK